MQIEVNIWAIILATVASMMIGYVWYGSDKFGFGKRWAELTKIDLKKSSTPLALISAALSALVMAVGIAIGMFVWQEFSGDSFMASAIKVGAFAWLGFQALRMFQRARFNQEPGEATVIHLANEFVTVLAIAVIVGLFGV